MQVKVPFEVEIGFFRRGVGAVGDAVWVGLAIAGDVARRFCL